MQPYVARKQKERFFEGFTKAASGAGVEELVNSQGPINRIFGPTGYEQGAQFYSANSSLDKFSSEVITDIDALKQMDPAEAAKALSAKSEALMTGDSGTNMLIQAGLIERMTPVMATVAKARVQWQQTTAINSMTTAHDDAANAFQGLAVASAALSDPSDETKLAYTAGVNTFLGGRGKPEGMTDESYLTYLESSAMSDIVGGRFYAVEAMRGAGAWKQMPEETQTKLDLAYERHSAKASQKAALPFVPDLIALETNIKLERISPMDAAAELARINAGVMAGSGTSIPLFDYKDFKASAGSVVDVLVAGDLRRQSRVEQIADANTRRGWDIEDRDLREAERAAAGEADAAEEATLSAQIATTWAMGDPVAGVAAGVPAKEYDRMALVEVRSGNVSGVIKAFKTTGWVSRVAAQALQAAVTSSIGEEYNPDVKQSHAQWTVMYNASPSAAAAHYGPLMGPMLKFNNLLKSTTPQNAFSKAFGDPTIYHPAAMPDGIKATAAKAIGDAIDGTESSSWNPFGATHLNASGRKTMTALLTNRVAALATGDNSLSPELLVTMALKDATADGSVERYGAFSWGNKSGTTPLSTLVGLKGADMDTVFSKVVGRQLKAAGYEAGADGQDYTITRTKLPNGHPALWIEARGDDGSQHSTTVTVADFKAYSQQLRDVKFIKQNGAKNNPAIMQRVTAYRARYGSTSTLLSPID
jgi:hypothetical protein